MGSVLRSPADVRGVFLAPPTSEKIATERSAELLRALRDNPALIVLNAQGGHSFMVPEVALKGIPFFQAAKIKTFRGKPNFHSTEEKTNSRAQELLRPKKLHPNVSVEVRLEEFPAETVSQFVQFRSGRGLPKIFDPVPLFQLADYVQDQDLINAVIFSRIDSKDPADYRFLARALTMGCLECTSNERLKVLQFIRNGLWREVLDDSLILHWIRDALTYKNSFSAQFLAECKTELLSFKPSKSPTHQRLVLKFITSSCLQFSPEEEKVIHTYISNEHQWEKVVTDDLIKHWEGSDGTFSLLFLAKMKKFGGAFCLYKQAAERGDPLGQALLGQALICGVGVEKNFEEGMRYCRLAAQEGNSEGLNTLGRCIHDIGRNLSLAFNYYYRSARQGLGAAQFNLAVCYEAGIGTTQDLKAAAYYYRLAADQGLSHAQKELARCLVLGKGVETDQEEGVRYLGLAVAQGDLDSIESLEDYHQHVTKNLDEADRLSKLLFRGRDEALDKSGELPPNN